MTNKEKANKINNLILRKKELEVDINTTLKELGINESIPICPDFPNFPDNLPNNKPFKDLIDIKLPIGYLLNYFISSCILRVKNGVVIKTYVGSDEFSRGAQLRIACDEAQSGEILYLSKGKFNINGIIRGGELFSDNEDLALLFPNDVTIIGMGISDDEEHRTTLYAKMDTDYTYGTAFQLRNTHLNNLVIETVPLAESNDVKTIGFHEIIDDRLVTLKEEEKNGGFVKDNYDVVISNCHIISNAWGFFSWSGKKGVEKSDDKFVADTCVIKNSVIESNRQGISLMGRGALSNRNKVEVYSCKFVIDGRYSKATGAVSKPDGDRVCIEKDSNNPRKCLKWDIYPPAGGIYGVISRATEITVKDCIFELTANRKEDAATDCPLPRCVGISDAFDNGSKPGFGVKIQSVNNTFTITANDASDVHTHLRMKQDTSFHITNSTTHIKEFEHSYTLGVTYVDKRTESVTTDNPNPKWYPSACE